MEINKKQETALLKALAVKPEKRIRIIEELQGAFIKAKKGKTVQEPKEAPVKTGGSEDVKMKSKTPAILATGFIFFLLMIYLGIDSLGINQADILKTEDTVGVMVDIEEGKDILIYENPLIDAQIAYHLTPKAFINEGESSINNDHNIRVEPGFAEESLETVIDSDYDELIEQQMELSIETQKVSELAISSQLRVNLSMVCQTL